MAGLGKKTFVAGEVLTAANVNGFLMDQSVMVFADAAARTTAIPAPTEGMVTYLSDTNALEVFTGASFVPVAEDSPITTQGDVIVGGTGGVAERLAIGTTGQILESDGTTLSYVTPDSSPDDIITTQGDLIIGNASANAARIGIGAASTVLTSDGTTATWEAVAGGGMTLLASGSLSAAALNLTSISADYQHLELVLTNFICGSSSLGFRFNGDANQRYNWGAATNFNSSVIIQDTSTQPNSIEINAGRVTNDSSNQVCRIILFDYATVSHQLVNWSWTRGLANTDVVNGAGAYNFAVAINRIASVGTLTGNFELWGIK